jgi:hypothetical protein
MAAKKPVKKISGPKEPTRVRMYEGNVVKNSLYDGPHGKFMAAVVEGKLLRDSTGRPLEFKQTGKLVWA